MKKLILTVVVILCLCLPAQADLYSWIWGDSDAIGARLGTEVSEDVEVGISALWWPDREMPEIWGIYGVYHLPEIVQFRNPIVLDFLPENIGGRPYFGGIVEIDFETDKGRAAPIGGIVFEDIIFIEYQFESLGDQGESKLIFGLRFQW